MAAALALTIFGALNLESRDAAAAGICLIVGVAWLIIGWFPFLGLKEIKPQEALVAHAVRQVLWIAERGGLLLGESVLRGV